LETRLTELGVSLNNTQFQLDQNEEDHIIAIEGLVSRYERRITIGKILFYTMIAVAVGEGIYILVGTLTK
jgi:ribosomal protein L35AE/L33A